jgi:hypothetical protein
MRPQRQDQPLGALDAGELRELLPAALILERLAVRLSPPFDRADDRFAEAIADNSALAIEPHGRKRLKGLGSVHASRLRSARIG